jgi:hypothetical protein
MSHKTNQRNRCLECGHSLELATGLNTEHKPNPGDVSICISCSAVAIFDGDLSLRKPTDEEAANFPAEISQEIHRAQTVTRAWSRTFGRN